MKLPRQNGGLEASSMTTKMQRGRVTKDRPYSKEREGNIKS
jgi:hypothetical protein